MEHKQLPLFEYLENNRPVPTIPSRNMPVKVGRELTDGDPCVGCITNDNCAEKELCCSQWRRWAGCRGGASMPRGFNYMPVAEYLKSQQASEDRAAARSGEPPWELPSE